MDEKQEVNPREILAEVREIKGKNAEALSHLRDLFEKADKEKKCRDNQNTIVKQSAAEIEGIRKQITAGEKKLVELQKTLEPFKREFGSPEQINAEIKSLEYSLQMHYSPSREKTVSKQIKALASQLKSLATIAPKMNELSKIRKELREARSLLSPSVKKLKEHANKSESHHQAMLQCFKEADEIRALLPEAFHELDEKRELLTKLRQEENVEKQKQHAVFDEHRKQAKANAQEKMQQVKTKAQEIMQKFKTGQPITFEELQVLQAAGLEV